MDAACRWAGPVAVAAVMLAGFGPAAPRVGAHEGPPFPVVVEERVGPWLVSVWTDPDIGIGRFWVVLEPADGEPVEEGTRVRVGVRPVTDRLPEAVYDATPERVRYGERHYAEVEFDEGEMWHVRVVIDHHSGSGEVATEVEATPDGIIGPIGMIFYMLPFLAVGFIWLRVALRKREMRREGGGSTLPARGGAAPEAGR